jgi:hypothetical protein
MDPFETSSVPSYGKQRYRHGSARESGDGILGQLSNVAQDVGATLNKRGAGWNKTSGYLAASNVVAGLAVGIWLLVKLGAHAAAGLGAILSARHCCRFSRMPVALHLHHGR